MVEYDKEINMLEAFKDEPIDTIIDIVESVRTNYPEEACKIIMNATEFQPVLIKYTNDLINEYLTAAEEIKKDKETLSPWKLKQKRKEHLKKLLTPLVKLNKLNPCSAQLICHHFAPGIS